MGQVGGLTARSVLAWLALMGVETVHGILRTFLLVPLVGDFRARQIGVVIGSVLMVGVTFLLIEWLRVKNRRWLVYVGTVWVALTLLFEIGAGHYIVGRPWDVVAADYNVAQGGLLPFGLVLMALAPLIAARLRARVSGDDL